MAYIKVDNSSKCSSHGECITTDKCQCNYGYEGDMCELHMCYGKSKNSSSVCSNQKGICIQVDQCQCFQTETGKTIGQECNEVKCIGVNSEWIDSNDQRVCSGVGQCLFNSSSEIYCNCTEGYTGPYCQYAICNGIPSYSKQVCNGNGQCVSPNTCSCFNDDTNGHYKGKWCEKCKAPYSGSQCNYIEPCGNETKCHSHGYCDEYGFCSCFQDVSNGYWNGSNCNYCNNGFYGEDCLTQIQSDVKFSNYGDSLVFKLSYPPHFTLNIVNCSKLFDSNKKVFGTNPVCKYLNKISNDFVIELDQDHNINVGDEIELNRNVFNRFSNVLDMTSVKVQNATNPSLPIIVISNKEVFTKCENVVIDASASYSLDRKFNSYQWEIISSNLNSIPNSNNSKLIIESLNSGNHTFQVTVTSYILKFSNIRRVNIQKLDLLTPSISIDGSSSIQVQTTDVPIIIRKLTESTCIPDISKQVISWEYSSGSGIEYEIDSFNNLKINKFNDLTKVEHQFKVSAYFTGYEQQISFAIVNIQLVVRPLTVNLILVESTPDYTTFEIEEIDPDNENSTMSRIWSLDMLESNSKSDPLLNYLNSNSNISTFTVIRELAPQLSKFAVSVQILKNIRSAVATIFISFPDSVAKIAPVITLVNSLPPRIRESLITCNYL